MARTLINLTPSAYYYVSHFYLILTQTLKVNQNVQCEQAVTVVPRIELLRNKAPLSSNRQRREKIYVTLDVKINIVINERYHVSHRINHLTSLQLKVPVIVKLKTDIIYFP